MSLALLILAALYFAPAIVALMRRHRQSAAIIVLNVFLGWTLIGWVVALVWAVAATAQTVVVREAGR